MLLQHRVQKKAISLNCVVPKIVMTSVLFNFLDEMLKAAKEQRENEMMANGTKGKGLFRKSRKPSQQVLTTRGTFTHMKAENSFFNMFFSHPSSMHVYTKSKD